MINLKSTVLPHDMINLPHGPRATGSPNKSALTRNCRAQAVLAPPRFPPPSHISCRATFVGPCPCRWG